VTGIVKWFNVEKGYGFIARDSGSKHVFVHISALERSGTSALDEGQPVVVDVVEGRKGLEAARSGEPHRPRKARQVVNSSFAAPAGFWVAQAFADPSRGDTRRNSPSIMPSRIPGLSSNALDFNP
jgi:CspA family cold shock protein